MANQNSANQDYQNNADGAQLGGGVIKRILKWLGADVTITGSGTANITLPSQDDTLVGRASMDTITGDKTFTGNVVLPNNSVKSSNIDFTTFIRSSTGSGAAVTGLTNSTYNYAAGMPSISFTLANAATIFFMGDCFIQSNGTTSTSDLFASVYDNGSTKISTDKVFTSVDSGNGGNIAITGSASLAAGAHTIDIRNLRSTGAYNVFPSRSSLTIFTTNE